MDPKLNPLLLLAFKGKDKAKVQKRKREKVHFYKRHGKWTNSYEPMRDRAQLRKHSKHSEESCRTASCMAGRRQQVPDAQAAITE
jgi:hypothetical protein